jgi:hypothetical protein
MITNATSNVKPVAILTVYNPIELTEENRFKIAEWLDMQRKTLLDYPIDLQKYTSKYWIGE